MKKIFTILCLFLFSGIFNLTAQLKLFEKPFGTYKLKNTSTEACITENAGQLSSAPFSNLPGQSWTITLVDSENDIYRISIGNKVLTADGSNVMLSSLNGSDSQLWKIRNDDDYFSHYYNIRLKSTGAFLMLSDSGFRLEEEAPKYECWSISHSAMYLVGSATPGGWDLNKAISMKFDEYDNTRYEQFFWSGYLVPGEFKFNPLKSSWAQALNWNGAGGSGGGYGGVPFARYFYDLNFDYQNDRKFKIDTAGYYGIGLGLNVTKMVRIHESPPVYNIVGSATPKGWDNINAEAMTYNKETGRYTWTGSLKAGELKFLSRLGSWNHCIWATFPNEPVMSGHPQSIFIGSNARDNKFIFSTAGNYTIELDTEAKTMIVRKEDGVQPIYLIGDATPAGWNNTGAIEMTQDESGTYTWSGDLKAGHFKFITQLGTWNSLVPARSSNEPVINGYRHQVSPQYRGDYRFAISKAGHYTVSLNTERGTMEVSGRSGDPVYLIGDATPAGWNNTGAIAMTQDNEESWIYTWTGTLKPGHFKFITQLGTWNSLVPVPASNQPVEVGKTYGLTNDYRGDYRFVVSTAGTYTITVDVRNHTLMVNPALKSATGLESTGSKASFTVTTRGGSVEVVLNGNAAGSASLYSLQGRLLDRRQGSGSMVLGRDLASGAYIVKIEIDNQVYSQKVVVR